MEDNNSSSSMAISKVTWLLGALHAMGVGSETFESDMVRILLNGSGKERAAIRKILRELIVNMDRKSARSLRNMLVHWQVDLDSFDDGEGDSLTHPSKTVPEERIFAAIAAVLEPATKEDLQFTLAELARERRRMRNAGAKRWR